MATALTRIRVFNLNLGAGTETASDSERMPDATLVTSNVYRVLKSGVGAGIPRYRSGFSTDLCLLRIGADQP